MPKIIAYREGEPHVLLVETDQPGFARVCDLERGIATPRIMVADAVATAVWIPREDDPGLLQRCLRCRERRDSAPAPPEDGAPGKSWSPPGEPAQHEAHPRPKTAR